MKRILELAAAVALTLFSGYGLTQAHSHEYKISTLEIVHPHARATAAKAPVSGGYMVIRNTGSEPDRLIAGSADFAGKVEIHEMKVENDVMKMRPVAGGLEIPAGGEVELKPGGYHVMFMQLKERLAVDESRKVTLTFEKAGTIEVEFKVQEIKPGGAMDHQGHGKMQGDKSGMHSMPSGDDVSQIAQMLKEHFDRAGSPLMVEPVSISGEWAVAGWSQDGRGGRGLLKKEDGQWFVYMCGGEGFKHAANLVQTGMPHDAAMAIATALADAEGKFGAEKIALFDSFEGVVEIGKDGHHGSHGDGQAGHGKHKHGS